MAKGLDFNNANKSFLPITFMDGRCILVAMPTKKIYDELKSISENSEDSENLEQIYSVLAKALSRNKAKKPVTKEYLEQNLDIEDVVLVFKAYVDFVSEKEKKKN